MGSVYAMQPLLNPRSYVLTFAGLALLILAAHEPGAPRLRSTPAAGTSGSGAAAAQGAPGGFPGPGGPPFGRGGAGGPGGPFGQERKLVKQFDRDTDGRLNMAERQAARQFVKQQGG